MSIDGLSNMEPWREIEEAASGALAFAERASAIAPRAPEVAVFGEWNTGNLGDRAIHIEVKRFFEDCGWLTRSFHLGSLSSGDEPAEAPDAGGGALRPPAKRAVRGVWQRVRMLRLLPRLERVQAISVGGGALLTDDGLNFPQSLMELARYARALDKPLVCLGCSAEGPWSARGWRMIREFLEACTVLAVRDSDTAARLATTLGARPPVFGDFCLTGALPAEAPRSPPGARHQLAINVSQLAAPWAAEQARLEDALVALARSAAARMAARGIGLCVFTTGLEEDARAARRVHALLEPCGALLYLPASLDQLSMLLSTACVVVATRLHAAVIPLAGRLPVAGLSASPRLHDFFATMNIGRYCYEPGSVRQLADWLALVNLQVVAGDQQRALSRSAVWETRARARTQIASLAAARGAIRELPHDAR